MNKCTRRTGNDGAFVLTPPPLLHDTGILCVYVLEILGSYVCKHFFCQNLNFVVCILHYVGAGLLCVILLNPSPSIVICLLSTGWNFVFGLIEQQAEQQQHLHINIINITSELQWHY